METKTLIKENSSKSRDPYVLYYNELYYYCFSRDDKIYISVAKSLEKLDTAQEIIVYKNKEHLKNLWAPELHIINYKCYIYVACDNGINENHRMYVLYNNTNNPLTEYKNHGIISDESNKWAIDGTILNYKNELFFIWSGCNKDIHYKQEIFIAKMESPFKLKDKKYLISTPEYDWEKYGGDGINLAFINEGPSIFKAENKIFLFYSASGCWDKNYSIGVLELIGNDPLKKRSWEKHKDPVFKSTNKIIGPGHCSFTIKKDKNKIETYMIFHSFNNKNNLNLENVNARYVKINYKNNKFIFED